MARATGKRSAPRARSYRAKVFRNGGSQAIRLPKECRVEGPEVLIRRRGRALVVESLGARSRTHPSWSKAFVEKFFRGPPRAFITRPPQGAPQPRDFLA